MTPIGGVDYSTKAVHAAIVAGKQLRFIKQYDLGTNPVPVLRQVLKDLEARGVTKIWLEQPFFVPARFDKDNPGKIKQGSNVNTLKLHRVPTQLETVADGGPISIAYVAPATWKSAILKGVPGETTKAKSKWFAAKALGFVTRDDNAADAICIATYGEAIERLHGLIPAGPDDLS